jgi:hypothetical protein
MDAASSAFASLGSMRVNRAPVATIRTDRSVSADGAVAPDLLLVIGQVVSGVNGATENGSGTAAMEPEGICAVLDTVFELLMGELESPLVAL